MFILGPIVVYAREGGNWGVALIYLVPIMIGLRIVRDELRFRKERVFPWKASRFIK